MPVLTAAHRTSGLESYAQLKRRVIETLLLGRARMKQEKARIYWETGRLIQQHILKNQSRGELYGKEVIIRLGGDLGISWRSLYEYVQFFQHAKILRASAKSSLNHLTLTHNRKLISVSDEQKREELAGRAIRQEWDTRTLQAEVKKVNARLRQRSPGSSGASRPSRRFAHARGPRPALLIPKRGRPGFYQITEDGETLALDLGFTSYETLNPRAAAKFKAGEIVELKSSGGRFSLHVSKGASRHLFTYPAELIRPADADTYWMKIRLKNPLWLREKLRLRGVDTPERGTQEGDAATKYVSALFHKAEAIEITTAKPDKWDRYLADIFLKMPGGGEIFLNNHLLEKRLARRKDSYSLEDWD